MTAVKHMSAEFQSKLRREIGEICGVTEKEYRRFSDLYSSLWYAHRHESPERWTEIVVTNYQLLGD